MKVEITCAQCGVDAMREHGQVNRARKSNAPLYCSQRCFCLSRRVKTKALGWFNRRFEPRETAVERECRTCGRSMWLPPSKVAMHTTCGSKCAKAARDLPREQRKRDCETCGSEFYPREAQLRAGAGKYCSHKCQPHKHLSAPEALAYAQQRRRDNQAAGLIQWKQGAEHHSWKGGKEATQERMNTPEKVRHRASALRKYRAENPHKIREWKQRRGKGKVLPRLPWGTVPRLGDMQRWRCAICRVSIKGGYHLDHIMPIAKGGKHEPRNLQLLCARCNVRKSAKDPIQYMQEVGRLL